MMDHSLSQCLMARSVRQTDPTVPGCICNCSMVRPQEDCNTIEKEKASVAWPERLVTPYKVPLMFKFCGHG
jgi:hypothetical protein